MLSPVKLRVLLAKFSVSLGRAHCTCIHFLGFVRFMRLEDEHLISKLDDIFNIDIRAQNDKALNLCMAATS
jgi:hypothetical protein